MHDEDAAAVIGEACTMRMVQLSFLVLMCLALGAAIGFLPGLQTEPAVRVGGSVS